MSLENKHVFVVEDDAANLAVISAILRYNDARVTYDRWGRETISKMKRAGPVDLILLDLMFPHGVTGYDIFDKIQAEPDLANVPVVVVTASDPAAELPKVQARGFAGYICKPINRHNFPKQLESILEGEPVWMDSFS